MNNKFYIIYVDYINIWVNGLIVFLGGVCFINFGIMMYCWRFKFYLICCVLVSLRMNVGYFIYIKKISIYYLVYIDYVLYYVMGFVFILIIVCMNLV